MQHTHSRAAAPTPRARPLPPARRQQQQPPSVTAAAHVHSSRQAESTARPCCVLTLAAQTCPPGAPGRGEAGSASRGPSARRDAFLCMRCLRDERSVHGTELRPPLRISRRHDGGPASVGGARRLAACPLSGQLRVRLSPSPSWPRTDVGVSARAAALTPAAPPPRLPLPILHGGLSLQTMAEVRAGSCCAPLLRLADRRAPPRTARVPLRGRHDVRRLQRRRVARARQAGR
jgi:hypothetical protein